MLSSFMLLAKVLETGQIQLAAAVEVVLALVVVVAAVLAQVVVAEALPLAVVGKALALAVVVAAQAPVVVEANPVLVLFIIVYAILIRYTPEKNYESVKLIN